jgi:hypothetical protein
MTPFCSPISIKIQSLQMGVNQQSKIESLFRLSKSSRLPLSAFQFKNKFERALLLENDEKKREQKNGSILHECPSQNESKAPSIERQWKSRCEGCGTHSRTLHCTLRVWRVKRRVVAARAGAVPSHGKSQGP